MRGGARRICTLKKHTLCHQRCEATLSANALFCCECCDHGQAVTSHSLKNLFFTAATFELIVAMRCLSATSFFLCLWLVERSRGNSSLGNSLSELHTEFSVSLYQTLTETENNSNLIVSPVSISLSLGLLQLGARGNTLAQLEGTMGYDVNDVRIQEAVSLPQSGLGNSSQGVRLQLTNTLFIQGGVQLRPAFTQRVERWYNSSVLSVNFSRPNHTQGQLQQEAQGRGGQEVDSGDGEEGALWWAAAPRMTLLSSVVFQGAWQKQFLFTETQNLPFTLSDGRTVKVPMMYQSTEVNFGQFRLPSEQRYTVLELPYLDRSLSLLVVLPSDRKTPLSQLEAQLTGHAVALWDTGLRRTKMDVFFPRFKMHTRVNLKPVLQSLGISDAFDPSAADFRGISGMEGLFVSEAFHEARMEVTEDGTKAAAATAMVLLKRSRTPVFKADRPFLFILRRVDRGSVLFMGRVLNPAEQVH
ncbi:probable serpin E3 isoform X2 [Pygocentrus nattereri]|uniref:probable serpin E3 isoform X2 n=1 Tax=Pygocentrus nattereri TaxID=42514 RepID=UPI001891A1CF|nr:probable serpin E3 isoform X2 [Pygocentrus nattereri]